jgi:hypothetical protein
MRAFRVTGEQHAFPRRVRRRLGRRLRADGWFVVHGHTPE